MRTYGQIQMIPLEEALPNLEIFKNMSGLSFIPDATIASYLDLEYFLNHSGRKIAAPLVLRLSDEDNYETLLANMITNRFRPKWEQLFSRYSDISTINLLNNINVEQSTSHGKVTTQVGSDNVTQGGKETRTEKGTETHTESYDANNPRISEREISGKYTDTENSVATRSGTQEVLESFPESRKSAKVTTGGYSDTDSVKNTRTGSQLVTDKGDTLSATFGFNSSSSVPTQVVGPRDSSIGTTQETTYGTNGLIDAHSGAITRQYAENGLKEEVTESGQHKTATTFGIDGLKDSIKGGTTRSYDNYKDKVTESGVKKIEISLGEDGKTNSLTFENRTTNRSTSDTVTNSGTDKVTETGYRYRRDELLQQYLTLFTSSNMIDFLEIIYNDVDEVLTLPIYI